VFVSFGRGVQASIIASIRSSRQKIPDRSIGACVSVESTVVSGGGMARQGHESKVNLSFGQYPPPPARIPTIYPTVSGFVSQCRRLCPRHTYLVTSESFGRAGVLATLRR
jgi:hypothetical protein